MSSGSAPPIRIAAALARASDGRVLLVRKRATEQFMQPGGKIEAREEPDAALVRELEEELGVSVDPNRLIPLGCFTALAANEPGRMVEAHLFAVEIDGPISLRAEIEEAVWIDGAAPTDLPLAPLTRDHVLPLCRSRNAG